MGEPSEKDWSGDMGDTEAVMARWSEAAGATVYRLTFTRMANGRHRVDLSMRPEDGD
jgi:hypothetical protein